ncbi:MAG: hypothetical protein ACLFN5_06435 [bacterium]
MKIQQVAHAGTPIHALVIGTGDISAGIVEQLGKNPRFNITWLGKEATKMKYKIAETKAVIRVIDIEKVSSPFTINELIEQHKPDIVFLCQRGPESHSPDSVASANLERELMAESVHIGKAPIISVSLEQRFYSE